MKQARIVLLGALLTFTLIGLYAFVGFDENNSTQTGDSTGDDPYHMKRRLPPDGILKTLNTEVSYKWPKAGVDVIYLWNHPLSDERQSQYNDHFAQELNDIESIPEESDSTYASLHSYLARGVELYLPWFRKLIVVLPDNIDDRPFNTSSPKVSYVKHSSILHSNVLPIFNWRSILLAEIFNDKNLSDYFLVVDDATFPISYSAPTSFLDSDGNIILPRRHPMSTPVEPMEMEILKLSDRVVYSGIMANLQHLGFPENTPIDIQLENPDIQDTKTIVKTKVEDEADANSNSNKSGAKLNDNKESSRYIKFVDFETRGLSFLSKSTLQILAKKVMDSQFLEEQSSHRFRRTNSLDIIRMHHQFIYLMDQLHRKFSNTEDSIRRSDANRDNKLDHKELIDLATNIGLKSGEVGKFITNLYHSHNLDPSKHVNIDEILLDSGLLSLIQSKFVSPEYRCTVSNSSVIAIELRPTEPLALNSVMEYLSTGIPRCLWIGPRIMGLFGAEARGITDRFLNKVLPIISSIEVIWKVNPNLSFYIAFGFFSSILISCFVCTKWLLRNPVKYHS